MTPRSRSEIARLLRAYRDRGVVAFDLAGGEAGRPPGRHEAAFDLAQEGYLGITVHAGEAAGPESVAEAISSAMPTGSATAPGIGDIRTLLEYIRDRRIPVEINITSNIQTRAVPRASDHPVREYFDPGSTSPCAPTAG